MLIIVKTNVCSSKTGLRSGVVINSPEPLLFILLYSQNKLIDCIKHDTSWYV